MTNKSEIEIAEEWIEKWQGDEPPAVGPGVGECELDWEIPRDNPELCLDVILEILSRIPASTDNKHFQVLAAGPLEDLIIENGEKVLDRIDELARRNPDFRLLLNGAWISDAKPLILERLSKYLGKRW